MVQVSSLEKKNVIPFLLLRFVIHQKFSLPVGMFKFRKFIISNPVTNRFPKKTCIKYSGRNGLGIKKTEGSYIEGIYLFLCLISDFPSMFQKFSEQECYRK